MDYDIGAPGADRNVTGRCPFPSVAASVSCASGSRPCAVQAAYDRFMLGLADDLDARLLLRAGWVEAIYRQEDSQHPVAWRIVTSLAPAASALR